jgi:hypothetical protein
MVCGARLVRLYHIRLKCIFPQKKSDVTVQTPTGYRYGN